MSLTLLKVPQKPIRKKKQIKTLTSGSLYSKGKSTSSKYYKGFWVTLLARLRAFTFVDYILVNLRANLLSKCKPSPALTCLTGCIPIKNRVGCICVVIILPDQDTSHGSDVYSDINICTLDSNSVILTLKILQLFRIYQYYMQSWFLLSNCSSDARSINRKSTSYSAMIDIGSETLSS